MGREGKERLCGGRNTRGRGICLYPPERVSGVRKEAFLGNTCVCVCVFVSVCVCVKWGLYFWDEYGAALGPWLCPRTEIFRVEMMQFQKNNNLVNSAPSHYRLWCCLWLSACDLGVKLPSQFLHVWFMAFSLLKKHARGKSQQLRGRRSRGVKCKGGHLCRNTSCLHFLPFSWERFSPVWCSWTLTSARLYINPLGEARLPGTSIVAFAWACRCGMTNCETEYLQRKREGRHEWGGTRENWKSNRQKKSNFFTRSGHTMLFIWCAHLTHCHRLVYVDAQEK